MQLTGAASAGAARLCVQCWDAQLHNIVYQEGKRLCRFTVSVGILDLAARLSEA